MSFRGRGRGRGGFGGGPPPKAEPLELFPEIEGLGTAEYPANVQQLVKWSWGLQKNRELSPYYYEDRSKLPEKQQKQDIERFSDRQNKTKDVKRPLWHFIKLSGDHMPAELADERKRVKRVKWTSGSDSPHNGGDMNKLDFFEKLEQQRQGKEGTEKKENEEEEDEEEVNEEEGEFSDEGDYEQADEFDDDEDDFNMDDGNDDEPCY